MEIADKFQQANAKVETGKGPENSEARQNSKHWKRMHGKCSTEGKLWNLTAWHIQEDDTDETYTSSQGLRLDMKM